MPAIKKTPDNILDTVALYRQGETIEFIADYVGVNKSTIRSWLKELGEWSPVPRIDKGKIYALYEGGWDLTAIMFEMKLKSEQEVIDVIREKRHAIGDKK